MPFKIWHRMGLRQDCRSSGTNEVGKRDFHSGNEMCNGRIILSDGGGERGGGGKTGKSRVFRKRLQKLLCVIGRACCATFAVWFEKFNFQQK